MRDEVTKRSGPTLALGQEVKKRGRQRPGSSVRAPEEPPRSALPAGARQASSAGPPKRDSGAHLKEFCLLHPAPAREEETFPFCFPAARFVGVSV